MSDELLRDLERRVRASPADFALGHELVRALERAGERSRARSVIARMALAGDREARRGLGLRTPPRTSAERRGERTAVRVAAPWRLTRNAIPSLDNEVLAVAYDHHALLRSRVTVRGVDVRTLAEAWRLDTELPVVALTDRLVVWHRPTAMLFEGRGGHDSVALHDPLRGSRVASRQTDLRILNVAGDGERIAVAGWGSGSLHLRVLDAATLEVLWSAPYPDRPVHLELCAGRLVVLSEHVFQRGATLQVFDAEDGATIWTRAFQAASPSLIALDPAGILVHWQRRYISFALEDGSDCRFDPALPTDSETCLTDDYVIFARQGEVETVSRRSGRSLWRAPLLRGSQGETLVVGDHIFSLRTTGARGPAVQLTAFELKTGLDVKRVPIEVDGEELRRPQLVALDGALLLLVGSAESLTVIRIEEDA